MDSRETLRPGSGQVRTLWTRFFEERGHKRIPSSSLIPVGDPTLLFTTAGMVQLKPWFMGLAEPPANRLISIQKCLRTSDIEAVGNERNQTFFEMLGNFSVGDYFKPEVIPWAWELSTTPWPNGLGLDPERIWATIYLDDEESFNLWRKVGIPPERICRFGEKENYWFAGPIGPCGPNSEINYDFGADKGCQRLDCAPNCENPMDGGGECDRFLEYWNLVFMTLYKAEDGSRTPLPQRNVDTGAGLARWATLLLWTYGVDWLGQPKQWDRRPTDYDTDLFRPIIAEIEAITGSSYDGSGPVEQRAMRIIADHCRAATFLIAEGLTPSNEGRGYVLRRLLRRGTLYALQLLRQGRSLPKNISEGARSLEEVGRRIGLHDAVSSARLLRLAEGEPFLSRIAVPVIDSMVDAYPDLANRRGTIVSLMQGEEARSASALIKGEGIFRQISSLRNGTRTMLQTVTPDALDHNLRAFWEGTASLWTDEVKSLSVGDVRDAVQRRDVAALGQISSKEAFTLHDTFGFDITLTAELAMEQGLDVDMEGFERELEAQRERSRSASRFEGDAERIQAYAALQLDPSVFMGYDTLTAPAKVLALIADARSVATLEATETHPSAGSGQAPQVEVVLDRTPFYAEGGGQIGDRGELAWSFDGAHHAPGGRMVVEDTQAVGEGGVVAHIGRLVEGSLTIGTEVEARVDAGLRADTMRNHTATHILHAALRQTLGSHVRQAGSYVGPDRLRFDFTHLEAMKPDEIAAVEALANQVVRSNIEVHVHQERYEDALAGGALAFFGDKYAETVRVVGICDTEGRHPELHAGHPELHTGHPEPVEGHVLSNAEGCFSKELCGGTHCQASGDVGAIVITAETSIGAGMRRIEAVTGRAAAERIRRNEEALAGVSAMLHAAPGEIGSRIEALQEEADALRRRVQALERRGAQEEAEALAASARSVNGVALLAARVNAANPDYLREVGDGLKAKLGSAVILLGADIGGRPAFLAMSTADVSKRVPAGDIVRAASQAAGGGGGGRPDIAQGGGTDVSKLDVALEAGVALAEDRLKA